METRLLKKQMTAAYQHSYARLVLNDYMLYDILSEQEQKDEVLTKTAGSLNRLLRDFLDGRDILESVKECRKQITHQTEILAAFTDCLTNFEYVLNRLERRFYPMKASGYSDEECADMLAAFIAGAEDSPSQKERISQVIAELPVRLTRQKFFDRVQEGLRPYIGSPKENLKDMMYMLRSEAMAELPDGMEEEFPDISGVMKELTEADYRNMTKEEYDRLHTQFEEKVYSLMDMTSTCMMLGETVNDLLVLTFAKEYAVSDLSEENLFARILEPVTAGFLKGDFEPLDSSTEKLLEEMEGRQEAYYERYMRYELPKENEVLRDDPDYIRLANVDRLISGSVFADLLETGSNTKDQSEDLTDREQLENEVRDFRNSLEAMFEKTSKPVIRAVMARVLSELPVLFVSTDEIRDYILLSLESCGDGDEKETCKELLEELTENENYLV